MNIFDFIRGFFMALADSVPGVSGGTVAFVLGFYDKLLDSLNSLLSKDKVKDKIESLKFLLKLGIGWSIGFICAVLFLTAMFEKNIYEVSSVFIGFIAGSIPIIIKEEKRAFSENYFNVLFAFLGVLIVFCITYFNPVSGGGINISFDNYSVGLFIYVFIAGMIAITAMVLPGISGSTLLLIFGLYTSIITSIKEVISFNFSSLPVLIIFALGVLAGIVVTIKLIRYLLKNHRSKMMYFILGLMIGSIYAVIRGPETLKVYHDPMNLQNFSFLCFLFGVAIIAAMEKLKGVLNK